jgi:RNA polymerase sigma factor (TIGR02999 family)
MNDVTRMLAAIERGESDAAEALLPLVYEELRKLAAHRLAREEPGQTLRATALVHEAYLRLVGEDGRSGWNGRGHFFGAAAEAMRRILVESARRKGRVRHGGGRRPVSLDRLDLAGDEASRAILDLNEALDKLEVEEPSVAELVKLRYFAGLTAEQAAEALGISIRTANRDWAYAKAWLFQQLSD